MVAAKWRQQQLARVLSGWRRYLAAFHAHQLRVLSSRLRDEKAARATEQATVKQIEQQFEALLQRYVALTRSLNPYGVHDTQRRNTRKQRATGAFEDNR